MKSSLSSDRQISRDFGCSLPGGTETFNCRRTGGIGRGAVTEDLSGFRVMTRSIGDKRQ
jgi:hypothetical protein